MYGYILIVFSPAPVPTVITLDENTFEEVYRLSDLKNSRVHQKKPIRKQSRLLRSLIGMCRHGKMAWVFVALMFSGCTISTDQPSVLPSPGANSLPDGASPPVTLPAPDGQPKGENLLPLPRERMSKNL